MLKSYQKFIKESIIDPTHDELCADVWDRDKNIRPSVRSQILTIFYDWKNNIKLNLEIIEIILVGSITGYKYSNDSDIDVHIEFDTNDKERIKRLRDIAPKDHILRGTNHPINFYLMTKGEQDASHYQGIFDLENNEWIKISPKREEDPNEVWQNAINQAISWARKYSLDIDQLRRNMKEYRIYEHFLQEEDKRINKEKIKDQINSKKLEIRADYDVLKMNKHMLRLFRTEAYNKESITSQILKNTDDPDQSLNNLTFKILEKFGYFEKAKNILELCEKDFPELIKVEE